eukprot:scaffold197783_cov43-Prasinocladus_malaysianus.AAC.1
MWLPIGLQDIPKAWACDRYCQAARGAVEDYRILSKHACQGRLSCHRNAELHPHRGQEMLDERLACFLQSEIQHCLRWPAGKI